MLNRRFIAAGCVAPVCAAAVFAASSFANRGDSTPRHQAIHLSSRVNKTLVDDFAVFRKANQKSGRRARIDAGVPALPTQLISNQIGLFGLDTADAQYTQSGSSGVWLIPGSQGACMIVSYPTPDGVTTNSAHCGTVAEITSRGLDVAMSWQPPAGSPNSPGVVVANLVPNGNSTVAVDGPTGSVQSEAVADNVAVHAFPYGNVKVSFTGSNGGAMSLVQQFQPLSAASAPAVTPSANVSLHKVG